MYFLACAGAAMTTKPVTPNFLPNGSSVKVNKPTLRAHGNTGVVLDYDAETEWYFVELDQGPPWRGRYPRNELEVLEP